MKTTWFIALLLFAAPVAHAGGNAEAGAGKVKICTTCHGADLNTSTSADIPRLAGQYADYIERALTDYRSGARKNAVMNGQVAKLSAQDIRDLAAYISSQKGGLKVVPLHRLVQ